MAEKNADAIDIHTCPTKDLKKAIRIAERVVSSSTKMMAFLAMAYQAERVGADGEAETARNHAVQAYMELCHRVEGIKY